VLNTMRPFVQAHPRFRRDLIGSTGAGHGRDAPFTRSDLIMVSGRWTSQIVGKTSPWINLESPCESVRRNSELVRARQREKRKPGFSVQRTHAPPALRSLHRRR
jgi:hypothetical protein